MSSLAASRSAINGSLRKTIAKLLADGLDSESIAASLEIPVELVESCEVRDFSAGSGESTDSGVVTTEEKLRGLSDTAISILGEILVNSDSDGIRMATSKFILEAAHGSLRRQDYDTSSTQNVNIIILQAHERYTEQLKQAKVIQNEPATIDL